MIAVFTGLELVCSTDWLNTPLCGCPNVLGEKLICFPKYGRCKISQNKENTTFSISKLHSESGAKYSFRLGTFLPTGNFH